MSLVSEKNLLYKEMLIDNFVEWLLNRCGAVDKIDEIINSGKDKETIIINLQEYLGNILNIGNISKDYCELFLIRRDYVEYIRNILRNYIEEDTKEAIIDVWYNDNDDYYSFCIKDLTNNIAYELTHYVKWDLAVRTGIDFNVAKEIIRDLVLWFIKSNRALDSIVIDESIEKGYEEDINNVIAELLAMFKAKAMTVSEGIEYAEPENNMFGFSIINKTEIPDLELIEKGNTTYCIINGIGKVMRVNHLYEKPILINFEDGYEVDYYINGNFKKDYIQTLYIVKNYSSIEE